MFTPIVNMDTSEPAMAEFAMRVKEKIKGRYDRKLNDGTLGWMMERDTNAKRSASPNRLRNHKTSESITMKPTFIIAMLRLRYPM